MTIVADRPVGKGQRRTKVKFGDVTIRTAKPSAAAVRHNVQASSEALQRSAGKLIKGGIRLYAKRDVPRYSVDPEQPSVLIRELNGRRERGRLENGVFKAFD